MRKERLSRVRLVDKRFIKVLIVGILLVLAFPQSIFASDSETCTMTIESSKHVDNPSYPNGVCKDLVRGFYVPPTDGLEDQFVIMGMVTDLVEYSGQQFILPNPNGKDPILTVYTVRNGLPKQEQPKPQEPPKQEQPKQQEPPKQEQPKPQEPPKQEQPKPQEPPKQEQPKSQEPSKQEQPKSQEPPKQEQPKQQEPPKQISKNQEQSVSNNEKQENQKETSENSNAKENRDTIIVGENKNSDKRNTPENGKDNGTEQLKQNENKKEGKIEKNERNIASEIINGEQVDEKETNSWFFVLGFSIISLIILVTVVLILWKKAFVFCKGGF